MFQLSGLYCTCMSQDMWPSFGGIEGSSRGALEGRGLSGLEF